MEKGSRWKKHFDRSQANLEHPDPARFVRGPWHPGPGPSVRAPFLAFRITMSILFLAGLGWSCADHWDSGKWLVFLTNWGFLTCTVQSLLATYLVLQEYRKQRSANPGESTFDLTADEKQMPLSYKIYWVLYNMALPVALFITILYWTILYKPNDDSAAGSKGPFFLNFVVHAANSILCLVELAAGGPPSRFLHVYQPVVYSTVYIAFNVIYWAAGGLGPLDNHYIYPVLDWDNNPNLGVGIVFGGAALLVVIHAVICALSELRTMVAHRLRKRKENNIGISTLPTLSTGNFNKGFVP